VELTGAGLPAQKKALASVHIAGSVTDRPDPLDPDPQVGAGVRWNVAGDVGAVSVLHAAAGWRLRASGSIRSLTLGASYDSDFLAGIDDSCERHADSEDDFVDAVAAVRSVRIAGWRAGRNEVLPERFFRNSNFSAASIGTTSILNGDFESGESGLFVLAGSLHPLRSVRHIDRTDNSNSWSWPAPRGHVFSGPIDFINIV